MPSTATQSIKKSCAKSFISPKATLNLILFLVAFGLLYYDTVAHIFGTWSRPEGSHGPLILAVSVYLVWRNKNEIKKLHKQPAILPGAIIFGLGCLMLFAGKLSSTILLQQISMVPALLGAILLFWGFQYLKLLFFPISYIIFLTGFFEEILGNVSIYLQTVSAWIAAQLLSLFGMPVFLSDTVIELPHISLSVVRACSGINHIVALMALTVPLAYISQRTLLLKLTLISASFAIGVFANGLRVALIGIYALYNHGADLHGPYETLYVSFIFFFGMIAVVVLSQILGKIGPERQVGRGNKFATTPMQTAGDPSTPKTEGRKVIAGKTHAPFITGFVIFAVAMGSLSFYKLEPVYLKNNLADFPALINGFSGKTSDKFYEQIRPFPADEELFRTYTNSSGIRAELYIGYFPIQDRGNKIIDYRRNWLHEEAQRVTVDQGAEPVFINHTSFGDGKNQNNVYFWYFLDGRIITNRYAGKLLTFWNALTARKTNGAVVIILTQNLESEIVPFLVGLVPMVQYHLSNT